MYPNLYYVFKDWFGVKWVPLSYLNTFGLMVAISFIFSAMVLASELKRKEKQGLLLPTDETIVVGKPASIQELLMNFILGFLFGYKLLGLFFSKPADVNAQDYIFSRDGSILLGLLMGLILAGIKWWEKNKQKQKEPETKTIRVWPHDRVGDIVIIALIAGIIGAKLFDNLENWDDFIQHPVERMFSASGLTFYGGLIVAALSVAWYGIKKKIKLIHFADAFAPALMIAYAIGRIGCQTAGDGDWGIFNSAYITNPDGVVVAASPADYQQQLEKYHTYFLNGTVQDSANAVPVTVTDRVADNLADVPAKRFTAPSFIPTWMVAYNYPGNVNKDGIKIPGDEDEHNRVLPVPVFPTPFYEIIACSLLFWFLWSIRKKITTPGVISGIYLILNGLERFTVEKIRVNNRYHIFGYSPTQAELISSGLIIFGVAMIFICLKQNKIKTEKV
jgi:phosphatidylglycerol---prolipoprotein diacylglyceryl transferase